MPKMEKNTIAFTLPHDLDLRRSGTRMHTRNNQAQPPLSGNDVITQRYPCGPITTAIYAVQCTMVGSCH